MIDLKILIKISTVIAALFLLTVIIYWFNLDSKAVKALEKPMMQHYDNLKRDRKL